MKKAVARRSIFFFITLFHLIAKAQYLPKDNSKLNYNQIMFEYPFHEKAKFHKVYLAYDSTENTSDFSSFPVLTQIDKTPATRIANLKFGKKYKWYVETNLFNGEKIVSPIHFFSIMSTPYADTSRYKNKQYYNKPKKIQDGIIWCDHNHFAINRKGELVWFIAPINKDFQEGRQIRDFRFYKDGTITFISEPEAYHVDRDLNVIWKGPNDGKIAEAKEEFYHHTFEKLPNGNYMTLGNDLIELERQDSKDTVDRKVEFATLIEYSKKGEVVWSWRMRDHFMFDLLASKEGNHVLNPHCNAFSIDKTGKYIYLGFRDISRIIKIEKTTGKIIESYGEKLNHLDTAIYETSIFSHPHDATIIGDNLMMVLNNNDVAKKKISSTEIFMLPAKKGEMFKSIWSFKFDFDTLTNGRSSKLGGNKLMTNGNVLINEGVVNRIVEVSKQKEVLWDIMFYKKDIPSNTWGNFPQYNIEFSSSLYPYYISVASKLKDGNMAFIIFNEGDFKDSYTCYLYSRQGELKKTLQTPVVINGAQKEVNFGKIPPGNYILKIHSKESSFVKTLELN